MPLAKAVAFKGRMTGTGPVILSLNRCLCHDVR